MSLRGRQADARSREVLARYLIATIGGVRIAVSAELIEGLLTLAESGTDGSLTVQGQVYAPMDLASRLGLPSDEDSAETRVILLAQGVVRASVRVACVHGLVECERWHVLPLPPQFRGPERSWYVGLLPLGEGVSVVLHAQWLLDRTHAVESSRVAAVTSGEQSLMNAASMAVEGGLSC